MSAKETPTALDGIAMLEELRDLLQDLVAGMQELAVAQLIDTLSRDGLGAEEYRDFRRLAISLLEEDPST